MARHVQESELQAAVAPKLDRDGGDGSALSILPTGAAPGNERTAADVAADAALGSEAAPLEVARSMWGRVNKGTEEVPDWQVVRIEFPIFLRKGVPVVGYCLTQIAGGEKVHFHVQGSVDGDASLGGYAMLDAVGSRSELEAWSAAYEGSGGNYAGCYGRVEAAETVASNGEVYAKLRALAGDPVTQLLLSAETTGPVIFTAEDDGGMASSVGGRLALASEIPAIPQAASQPDSVAVDVAGVVADLNTLLASLRAAGLMAPLP